jgi:hypothetical protein
MFTTKDTKHTKELFWVRLRDLCDLCGERPGRKFAMARTPSLPQARDEPPPTQAGQAGSLD